MRKATLVDKTELKAGRRKTEKSQVKRTSLDGVLRLVKFQGTFSDDGKY